MNKIFAWVTWKKFIIPSSLYGRFLLIIVIPVIIVQIVVSYIFYQRHWQAVRNYIIRSLAGEIKYIVELWKEKNMAAIDMANHDLQLYAYFVPGQKITIFVPDDSYLQELISDLYHEIHLPINLIYDYKTDVKIELQLPEGILNFIVPRKRLFTPTTYIFTYWMLAINLVMMLFALQFARIQLRAVTRLSKAAEQFGRGLDLDKFKPEGAKEVKQAGYAFLRMKKRIERQITQRTIMLAGVSHDLRTPLTRIKLALEFLPQTPEIEEIKLDLIEMEKLIQAYLNFAGDNKIEELLSFDLASLLTDIVASYNKYKTEIIFENKAQEIIYTGRKDALKRAFVNIIGNGVKYSQTENIKVLVSLAQDNGFITIEIEDNGPGIPPNEYDNIFQPFYRIDKARNMASGGVGLGLSIAHDIITQHGGNIEITKAAKLKGAKFTVILPNDSSKS